MTFAAFVTAFAVGICCGVVARRLVAPILQAPVFARTNYRGTPIAVGGGLVLVVALILAGAIRSFVPLSPTNNGIRVGLLGAAGGFQVVLGFALLGLLDDLAGTGADRGFRGHLCALSKGRLTTGGLKLFGGGLLSLYVVRGSEQRVFWLLVNGAIVALCANFFNLLDRRPGRSLKVSILINSGLAFGLGLAGLNLGVVLVPLMFVIAVSMVMLFDDLREASMLGDTGSNALGGVVGASLIFIAPTGRIVVLAVLLALNLASERVSFSSVIDRVGPLRWVDRLGTLPERRAR